MQTKLFQIAAALEAANIATELNAITGQIAQLDGEVIKARRAANTEVKTIDRAIAAKESTIKSKAKTTTDAQREEARANIVALKEQRAAHVANVDLCNTIAEQLKAQKGTLKAKLDEARKAAAEARRAEAASARDIRSNFREELAKYRQSSNTLFGRVAMLTTIAKAIDDDAAADIADVLTLEASALAIFRAVINALGVTIEENASVKAITRVIVKKIREIYPYTLTNGEFAALRPVSEKRPASEGKGKRQYVHAVAASPDDVFKTIIALNSVGIKATAKLEFSPCVAETEDTPASYNYYWPQTIASKQGVKLVTEALKASTATTAQLNLETAQKRLTSATETAAKRKTQYEEALTNVAACIAAAAE